MTAEVPMIYAIRAEGIGRVKIGYSSSLKQRVSALRCQSPVELRLIATATATRDFETRLHRILDESGVSRLHGEWFAIPESRDSALREIFAAIDLFERAADDSERFVVVDLLYERLGLTRSDLAKEQA